VGIAGVYVDGEDVAYSDFGNPKTARKLGLFGFDRSIPLDRVRAGRGLANIIALIQVPPVSKGGKAGPAPWMAGGQTITRVDAKDSIKPFVWKHGDKEGTFVLMADGSVRFITKDISDPVFKAMCTVEGRDPKDFKLDRFAPRWPEPIPEETKPAAK